MQGDSKIDRRQIIAGITGLAGLSGMPAMAASGAAGGAGAVSVPANGRAYERVALRSDAISVAAVQSRIRAVDGQAPEPGIRDNLAHMLDVIDKVQFFGGTKDLLCFHEFPLQGWNPRNWSGCASKFRARKPRPLLPGPGSTAVTSSSAPM
jgi:hypothetical protein